MDITGRILDIGGIGAFFGGRFFTKIIFLLAPPKQISFAKIANNTIFSKSEGTKLDVIIAPKNFPEQALCNNTNIGTYCFFLVRVPSLQQKNYILNVFSVYLAASTVCTSRYFSTFKSEKKKIISETCHSHCLACAFNACCQN